MFLQPRMAWICICFSSRCKQSLHHTLGSSNIRLLDNSCILQKIPIQSFETLWENISVFWVAVCHWVLLTGFHTLHLLILNSSSWVLSVCLQSLMIRTKVAGKKWWKEVLLAFSLISSTEKHQLIDKRETKASLTIKYRNSYRIFRPSLNKGGNTPKSNLS